MNMDFEHYLAVARAKNCTEQAFISFLSRISVGVITVVGIWSMFAPAALLSWLAAYILVAFFALRLHQVFGPSSSNFNVKKWQAASYLSTFLPAFSWGIVTVIFFAPDNILYLAIMVAFYTGYIAGALTINFAHHPTFLLACISITIPFAGRMFYEGSSPYVFLGWLSVFFVISLGYISKKLHELFIVSTRNQFDNIKLLDELAKEKEAVEQAVATKDRFLAAASHDLRQPLNAISLFADALRPLQTKPLGNEIVDKVQLSLKGLNGMLHSLLDISKLDANATDNQPAHLSLHTLIEELVTEYRSKASHLELCNEVDHDVIVFCDPTILYRVIRNLLDNAVKYTQQGQVVISCKCRTEICELYIRDSGVGIPQNQIESVFDEFHQLNNPERDRDKGLGLGLAIVKRLCDLANIDVELESKIGVGTTVKLSLATGIAMVESERAGQPSLTLSGRLIVIIDDEQDIRHAMQLIISAQHADVIVAESLAQALSELTRSSTAPSLIISDFRLREGAAGVEAIDAIREEYNRDIPAIIITGDTSSGKIDEMHKSANRLLYKPVNTQNLLDSIAALINDPVMSELP